jgi:UDP-N-acetylmuramoyl-tripeptide--D-alanyl-D-alanine ligase
MAYRRELPGIRRLALSGADNPDYGRHCGGMRSVMNVFALVKSVLPRINARYLRWHIREALAPLWRPALSRVRFIAVTGSVGKTTTVFLLGKMLETTGKTYTGALINTGRGFHKTILATSPFHRWTVQEVSGHTPGHIRAFGAKLRPKVGIVTAVGTDHIRTFRSREAIAEEKGTLVEMLPADGTAFLNADDPLVFAMRTRAKARVVTYGLSEAADLRAVDVRNGWPASLSFTVLWRGKAAHVQTRMIGAHWVTPILAALACALDEGVPLDAAIGVIADFTAVYGRTSIHPVGNGPVFVLDTEKAPFGSLGTSIEIIGSAEAPRKTLVIGNISDYTGSASSKYRKFARDALAGGARIVGVGRNAATVRKLVPEFPGLVHVFETSREARDFFASDVVPGELILLKSAASGHIERIFLNWANGDERCWVEECGLKYCRSCRYLADPQRVFRLPEAPVPNGDGDIAPTP